jgi:phage-related protein
LAGGTKLGEAYIQVTADARRVGAAMSDQVQRELEGAAAKIGDSFSGDLKDEVDRSTDGIGDGLPDKFRAPADRSAGAFADAFAKRLRAAAASLPPLQVGAATTAAEQQLRDLTVRIQSLRDARIGVDLDAGEALGELDLVRAELDRLGSESADVSVRVDTAGASAELARLQSQLGGLSDNGSLSNVAGQAGRASGGLGLLTASALAVSPALIAIAGAAVAGIGAIAPLAAGAAAGLGVLFAGFSGVGDAVKLLDKRENALASTAGSAGGSMASSARAVESAEASLANTRANAADAAEKAAQTVIRAREDEKRAEVDAAHAIADAVRGVADARDAATASVERAAGRVADAERNAADRINSALDREESAERSLAAAQKDAKDAQEALTDARRAAQRQIEDLAASITDNALAQRQSVLDVAQAQRVLDAVLANPRASDAAREAARIAYEEQVAHQQDLLRTARRLAEDQAQAAATGVDGSDQVVAAQDRIAQANQRVVDAQKQVQDTGQAVDRARSDGAASVADAQAALLQAQRDGAQRVADAEQKLADTRVSAAQRVADAQTKVSDALRDQSIQARQAAFSISQAESAVAAAMASGAAAGGGVSGALAGVNRELAKVNPATLAFAQYVRGTLLPAWEQVRGAAAGGLLPGVQAGIDALLPYLPQITAFASQIGTQLGGMFASLGAELTKPFWTQFFTMIASLAGPALSNLYDIGLNVAEAFAGILQAFAPMSTDVGNGIVSLTQKFADWAVGLKDSQGFHDFIDWVKANWPSVQSIVENLATAVVHLVQGMGQNSGPAVLILRSMSDILAGLSPDTLNALVMAFAGFSVARSAASSVGDLVQQGRDARDTYSTVKDAFGKVKDTISDMPDKISGMASSIRSSSLATKAWAAAQRVLNLVMSMSPLGIVLTVIGLLVAAFITAWTTSETFRARVKAVLDAIGAFFSGFWSGVKAVFTTIVGFFTGLPGRIRTALGNIAERIRDLFGNMATWARQKVTTGFTAAVTWIRGLPGRVVTALGNIATRVSNVFQTVVRWVQEKVRTGFNAVVTWITSFPGNFVRGLGNISTRVANIFKNLATAAKEKVTTGFTRIVEWIKGVPGKITALGRSFLDAGKTLIQKIVDGIGAAASYVGGVARKIVNGVIGFVNDRIINGLNNMLDFTIMGVHINPPDIPHIPTLAAGAVVDRATLAVVGEAGPEAVVPLSRPRRRDEVLRDAGLAGGSQVTVTYAPQVVVPRVASAAEVAAIVGNDLVRNLRLGILGSTVRDAA